MSANVSVVVPEITVSTFLVGCNHMPRTHINDIHMTLPEPFTGETPARLGTPALSVLNYRAADSPWDGTGIADGDACKEAFLREASNHLIIGCSASVADQPLAAQTARALAKALAAETGGVLLDLDTGRFLPGFGPEEEPGTETPAPERPRLCLADDWIGDELPVRKAECPDPAPDDRFPETMNACTRVKLTTRGLSRFGLPELRVGGVACDQDLPALNLLRIIAQWLYTRHQPREGGLLTIPAEPEVFWDEFDDYWLAARRTGWTEMPRFRVRLRAQARDVIHIDPPGDYGRSMNEWLWEEMPGSIYDVLHCSPADGPPGLPGGVLMHRAM